LHPGICANTSTNHSEIVNPWSPEC
jgi:hypothetical protein